MLFLLFRLLSCFFFFSSRRRHTRCLSDWSSDVCSSDLAHVELADMVSCGLTPAEAIVAGTRTSAGILRLDDLGKIGRASCRERGEMWVVGVSGKKKKKKETDEWREQ